LVTRSVVGCHACKVEPVSRRYLRTRTAHRRRRRASVRARPNRALAIRDEQSTTTELLQAIHALVDNHVAPTEPSAPPYYPPPAQYAQPPQYQAPYQPQYQQPGGGALQRFLGGRFGRAIVTGAGIGIGDDIVNSIFDRF
jgi:hypothetical protein